MTAVAGSETAARARSLGIASVVALAATDLVGVVVGAAQGWRLLAGAAALLAVGLAVHAVVTERSGIASALLVGALPPLALLGDGSPALLIGPCGVALFAAAELHALSWDLRGGGATDGLADRRLAEIARVAVVGLAASALVALVTRVPAFSGTAASGLAVAALAGLAAVTFRGGPVSRGRW